MRLTGGCHEERVPAAALRRCGLGAVQGPEAVEVLPVSDRTSDRDGVLVPRGRERKGGAREEHADLPAVHGAERAPTDKGERQVRTARFPKPQRQRGEKPVKRAGSRRPIDQKRTFRRRGFRGRTRLPGRVEDRKSKGVYAEKLWREIVRLKEPHGICPNCRKRPWSDAAHGFPKGPYPWMKFEPTNGIPLCRPCHRRVDSDFAAKSLLWTRYVGEPEFQRLFVMSQGRDRSKLDIGLVILDLEGELERARANE